MMAIGSREVVIQNLEDAGCGPGMIEDFLGWFDKGQQEKQLELLGHHRERLLGRVHKDEKRISCLDYLIYQIQGKPAVEMVVGGCKITGGTLMKDKEIRQEYLTGERVLFQGADLKIYDSIFADGESPLKESHDVELENCMFKWKYPFWYAKNITARNCTWFEMARAGVWYTDHITVEDAVIEAPKNFRRCRGVNLKNVNLPNAAETLWNCEDVELDHVTAKGDYFAMNSRNMVLRGFQLVGNYSFDGVKNMEIHNAHMLSKDAFWNTENVTVYDSFISGEYLGWNAKNLTLINCTIESLQGMCYIDNLVMKNCKLLNTTLAFEYSTVDAEVTGKIDSVMNPSGGVIRADHIDELIVEKDKVDPAKTKIICRREWKEAV